MVAAAPVVTSGGSAGDVDRDTRSGSSSGSTPPATVKLGNPETRKRTHGKGSVGEEGAVIAVPAVEVKVVEVPAMAESVLRRVWCVRG